MKYRALIENRKSVREFKDKPVSSAVSAEVGLYYANSCRKLTPDTELELHFIGSGAGAALEGAAGYENFLVGAPRYMVLLSETKPYWRLNAGYVMEDLILKLAEMDVDSCWVTFTDSKAVKEAAGIDSPLEVAAIVAFGYGEKTVKRLRLNKQSMSNVDVVAERGYFSPKRSVRDMVYLNDWGKTDGVEDYIGFYDDLLWEALYAASLSPSYLNRQPYGFLLKNGSVYLVSTPDDYTGGADLDLNLGIVLLHFAAAAEELSAKVDWDLAPTLAGLPEGAKAVASCKL